MTKNQWPYDRAEEWVRVRRQAIYPNDGFVYQLRLFEEMGFTLKECANNLKLRRFLIRSFMKPNRVYWLSQFNNRIQEYYKKRDFIESLTENLNLGADCLCAKCDYKLFNEIHMIFNTEAEAKVKCEEVKAQKVCDYTYIEPQKWMKELLPDFNIFGSSVAFVKCPECEVPLVEFMRYYKDFACYCPKHKAIPNCLIFRIKTENFKIVSKD